MLARRSCVPVQGDVVEPALGEPQADRISLRPVAAGDESLANLGAPQRGRVVIERCELLREVGSGGGLQSGRSWIRTTDLRLIRAAL